MVCPDVFPVPGLLIYTPAPPGPTEVFMNQLQFFVPTLFGLEGLAADELRRLNLADVRAENGHVLCTGRPGDIPRLNLNLRTGERVLLVLGSFHAPDFDALFEGVKAIPWEEYLPRTAAFPVKGQLLSLL